MLELGFHNQLEEKMNLGHWWLTLQAIAVPLVVISHHLGCDRVDQDKGEERLNHRVH